MKRYFLFVGINLNLNITKKSSQKNACFTDESLKKGLWIFKCWGLVVVCPILIKISGNTPARGLHSGKFSPWLKTIIMPLVCRLHKFSVSTACVFFPVRNHEMWIMWKVIVRETCFCETFLADFTVSSVFQKYFNFVPMLESCNVDHVKGNCSWDMFLWINSGGLQTFMSFSKIFNFVPMLESRNVDHMKSNCSDITVSSVLHNYFNIVPMLESRNTDQLKNNFSCDFFCEKILAHITISWNFQNYLNFLPTLQLQSRNVSQLKDNVHETHLFWKYTTYVAILSFFNYINFLPMLEWFKLGLLLFRFISSNGQLTKHSSNGS